MRITRFTTLVLILGMASTCWASPDTTLSVTPSATSGTTITAADENARNNAIATAFNNHSHVDISAMSGVNSFTIGDGTAGTKSYLVDDSQAASPGIRYSTTSGYWSISSDGSTFDAVGLSSGVVIQGENAFRIGDGTALNNKQLVANEDSTDGFIQWNVSTNRWELSNNASTSTAIGLSSGSVAQPVSSEDDFFVGDGTNNAHKRIYANTASGLGAKPQLRYNVANSSWEFSNDGVSFSSMAGETGTWSDVTASRAGTTIYQNTSGKKRRLAIVVIATANAAMAENYVEVGSSSPPTIQVTSAKIGVAATGGEAHKGYHFTEVPANHYYRLTLGAGNTLSSWAELDE